MVKVGITIKLSSALPGNFYEVKSINLEKNQQERILDLGLIPGTKIKVLQKSPLGDPVSYFIRGSVIALRKEHTSKILVKKI